MAKKREPLSHVFLVEGDEQVSREAVVCRHIAEFSGLGNRLGAALGALVLGQHYGTRVLRMIHSPSTYRKYERILGIRFEDFCPEDTHLSGKNWGFKAAKRVGAFWDVVMGRNKVEKKGWIDDSNGAAS